MSSKRPRSPSPSSSRSSSTPPSPTSKLLKVVPDTLYTSLTCTLPPTCSHPSKPIRLSSARDVEEHYEKYHTYVCEHEGCTSVFPDARFLELHFAECHDPIIALKKERGEKTFACYLSSCARLFLTPKGRRLHLIQAHGYPKQYFFAVTNKGIGGLLHKWGQGASLHRGDWRQRVGVHGTKSGSDCDGESKSDSGSEMDVEDDRQHQANGKQRPPHMEVVDENSSTCPFSPSQGFIPPSIPRRASATPETDSLTNAMSSLALVPDKIRFGRGGKKGGFAHSSVPRSTRAGHTAQYDAQVNADTRASQGKPAPFRGRGGRRHGQGKVSQGTSSTSADLNTTGDMKLLFGN